MDRFRRLDTNVLRVYVAAASAELRRAALAMDLVRHTPGLALAHDGVATILQHGSANAGLTDAVREAVATEGLAKVREADLLWLLCPNRPTVGAWVELGHFLRHRPERATPRYPVVVSGPGAGRTIFTATAEVVVDTDEEAAAVLREIGRAQTRVPLPPIA